MVDKEITRKSGRRQKKSATIRSLIERGKYRRRKSEKRERPCWTNSEKENENKKVSGKIIRK